MAAKKSVVKTIKKLITKEEPKPVTPPVDYPRPEGVCVECGGPLAPGQNYVCVAHQRTN